MIRALFANLDPSDKAPFSRDNLLLTDFYAFFQIGFLGAGGAKCTFDWSFGLIWILPNLAKSDWGFPNWLWHIYLCEGHLEYLTDVWLWKIAWTHFELVCEIFVRYFHIWNISDFWHAPERRRCQTGGQYCLGRKIKIVKQRIELASRSHSWKSFSNVSCISRWALLLPSVWLKGQFTVGQTKLQGEKCGQLD